MNNELIRRYKENYGIPVEADITEQMVLRHWELEKQLTLEILQSVPGERWDTADRCYTRLYTELEWLNRFVGRADSLSPSRFDKWKDVIGPPPKSVYEIGSGKGELISYLAQNGFDCKGTEITRQRGRKLAADSSVRLSWGISDGVHLDRFEPPESYDVVVSHQVIEHLHPDDLQAHMEGVYRILKGEGRYIFSTPHRYSGPHDVSWVFELDEPKGMHLKEYTYRELVEAVKNAGFTCAYYAFIPGKLRTILRSPWAHGRAHTKGIGTVYLRNLLLVEKLLSGVSTQKFRCQLVRLLRKFYIFSDDICLIAEKNE